MRRERERATPAVGRCVVHGCWADPESECHLGSGVAKCDAIQIMHGTFIHPSARSPCPWCTWVSFNGEALARLSWGRPHPLLLLPGLLLVGPTARAAPPPRAPHGSPQNPHRQPPKPSPLFNSFCPRHQLPMAHSLTDPPNECPRPHAQSPLLAWQYNPTSLPRPAHAPTAPWCRHDLNAEKPEPEPAALLKH